MPVSTLPSKRKRKFVLVSPEMATRWLTDKPEWLRPLDESHARRFAAAMARGDFQKIVSEIGLWEKDSNKAVMGRHRCRAVIIYGHPVLFEVRYGVTKIEALRADVGNKPQTLIDQLRGERPKMKNRTLIASVARICARVLFGAGIRLVRVEEFDLIDALVPHEGIAWATSMFRAKRSRFEATGVVGAFALAYHVNPQTVEELAVRLRDSVGLIVGEPAYALTRASANPLYFRQHGGTLEVPNKTLTCIYAHLHGQKMTRVFENADAVRFFVEQIPEPARVRVFNKLKPFILGDTPVPHTDLVMQTAVGVSTIQRVK